LYPSPAAQPQIASKLSKGCENIFDVNSAIGLNLASQKGTDWDHQELLSFSAIIVGSASPALLVWVMSGGRSPHGCGNAAGSVTV
jgi:hypothetical protein